jgi:hypothetical protein
MDDIEDEIEFLQAEINRAKEVLEKAVRDRRALHNESPLRDDCVAAVVAAREALAAVEIKLRMLYESKNRD